jgi:hypothetical protein
MVLRWRLIFASGAVFHKFLDSVTIKCFRLGLKPFVHRLYMTDAHFRRFFINYDSSVVSDTLIDQLLSLNSCFGRRPAVSASSPLVHFLSIIPSFCILSLWLMLFLP